MAGEVSAAFHEASLSADTRLDGQSRPIHRLSTYCTSMHQGISLRVLPSISAC